MACSAGGSVAALAALLLAAVVLTESAPVAAEPMDFRIVSRPKHWCGLSASPPHRLKASLPHCLSGWV